MSDLKTIVLGAAAASVALALAVQPAAAADYPCKTMRVVVASSAGGGTDVFENVQTNQLVTLIEGGPLVRGHRPPVPPTR